MHTAEDSQQRVVTLPFSWSADLGEMWLSVLGKPPRQSARWGHPCVFVGRAPELALLRALAELGMVMALKLRPDPWAGRRPQPGAFTFARPFSASVMAARSL
ncbi:hypothetical protein P7K49_005926 [Saguinus oedipus]|uniref:Uncharacterized protein n=1 Tax=Saguinus oedipus TaxID=9490 RepID=A0ABQ9W1H3_SAGOE|nr:hypothetical protein P7K49_005926 [Saguinus oedipus]